MSWPETADGDVFRRLEEHGFDFSAIYAIDFNVDFGVWPPAKEAIAWLERKYAPIEIHDPEEDFNGWVSFKIEAKVTYELVITTQEVVSEAMAVHHGVCESWGVLQEPS